ncbi:hypothetical protein [Corallococcus sp. EGB]|uniref:hypothetical protein n=1 Tax=Corallococcus sp. EGB TaxID=1521117 RepID=UPI00351D6EE0
MLAFVPAQGPIAGALLAQHLGWRALFVTLGVLATAAMLHAFPCRPETHPAGGPRPAGAGPAHPAQRRVQDVHAGLQRGDGLVRAQVGHRDGKWAMRRSWPR